MVSFFGFGQSAEIAIQLKNEEQQRTTRIRVDDGQYETFYLFYDGENVEGEVLINLKKPGQKLEHQGIRIDFVGQIEVYYDRGNQHDFLYQSKELSKAGDLYQNTKFEFCFANASKPYETYMGSNVKLRYFLRVTIMRRLTDIVNEMEIAVHSLATYPDNDASIKMEVGIEDCLHIEFEYNKSRYHLKDVIVGKIYFLLVRIKIKYMEIAILKRESVGNGPNIFNESDNIAKYEIMDGAPVKGESIPIRLFLAGYDLTPTMRDVAKRFSVRYFLNLVLIDEEDRRYFKQQEIILWRRLEKPFAIRQPIQQHFQQSQGPTARASMGSPPSSPLPTNSSVEELIENKQENEEEEEE
uniref:Vacuolar protein sorting-associated protein 26 n=1 Tax=Meloidogyne incognita TaxID=6306 RepID=A0A914MME4_MELIC